jgi:hypothetical protein
MLSLGGLDEQKDSCALDINNVGQAVRFGANIGGEVASVIYENGAVVDLGCLAPLHMDPKRLPSMMPAWYAGTAWAGRPLFMRTARSPASRVNSCRIICMATDSRLWTSTIAERFWVMNPA